MHAVLYTAIYGYVRQAPINNIHLPTLNDDVSSEVLRGVIPGLASNKNLAGVHDTAGKASRVDGAQGRAELDNVGPDQRLREQTCMLPRRGRFMLPCTRRNALSHKRSLKVWTTSNCH